MKNESVYKVDESRCAYMYLKKMKALTLFCLATILLVGCSSRTEVLNNTANAQNQDQEIITLRVGTGIGTTHIINDAFLSRWMEEVEKQTNHKVQFETHYSGSLVAMGREYEALNSGLVDIVLPMFQVYDPVRFPLSEVTMLPLLDSNVKIATSAYEELVIGDYILENNKTFHDIELKSKDLKMWTTPTTEGYNLSFVDKDRPQNVADLTNVTFRSSGRISEITSKDLGINSISIPASEIYDALSRGSIDGLYFSIPDWSGYGIDELFSYTITGVNLGHFSHTFGMTQETWNSLPKDVQEVMDKVAKEELHSPETYAVYDERMEQALKINKAKGGIVESIDMLPKEVQEAINNSIVQTWKEWIELNEKNGLPGKKTALLWRDLILKHGGNVPQEIKEMK